MKIVSAILFLILISLGGTTTVGAFGEDRSAVFYGGLFLSGGKNSEADHPIFARNRGKLAAELTAVMESMKGLPFSIISNADAEETKKMPQGAFILAIVVTRDDIVSERYSTPVAEIFKTSANVGLVVIIYRTDDIAGEKRNTIIFSVPLVGYSLTLQGKTQLTEAEIDELFRETAVKTLRDHLSKRLQSVGIHTIKGSVREINGDQAIIDVGAVNGLEEGHLIQFLQEGRRIATGRVEKLNKADAVVKSETEGFVPQEGTLIVAANFRGQSLETYQVVRFDISSRKAAAVFSEKVLGPQAAQWFSDFLADRSGKVVLPARVGGEWDESATIEAASTTITINLTQDDEVYKFRVPNPKYPVSLDLTGIAGKKIEGNNVNEIWMYKVWLKVEIPGKKISREFDAAVTKRVVPGMQAYQEKDEYFDLLHQLIAKICREASL